MAQILNLSPQAAGFWGSIIRHALTGLAAGLVTHGYVSQTGASQYVEELTGAILYGLGQFWANRVVIANRAKMLTALWLHKGATENDVNAMVAIGNSPSASTPPNTPPGIPAK